MSAPRPPAPPEPPDTEADAVTAAAERARRREQAERDNPATPVTLRLVQIGVLGWTIVTPMLLGAYGGHLLDRWAHTGVTFSAGLLVAGAALGLWLAWRWMHRQ